MTNIILLCLGSFFAGVTATLLVLFVWSWLRSARDFAKLEQRDKPEFEVDNDA